MASNTIETSSFTPVKSETYDIGSDPTKFAEVLENAWDDSCQEGRIDYKNHPISAYENFEAIKTALDKASTLEEQREMSYVMPIRYEPELKRYILPPGSERVYQYIMEHVNNKEIKLDITKSRLYLQREERLRKKMSETTPQGVTII